MTVLRVSMIALSFLFAHDLMMAVSHQEPETESHHSQVTVESDCGPVEGTTNAPQIPVTDTYCDACALEYVPLLRELRNTPHLESHVYGENSATLRVRFQVFLN